MQQHSEQFKQSKAYKNCFSFLNHAHNHIESAYILSPGLALSNLNEKEIEELYQSRFKLNLKEHLDKSKEYKQALIQMYFNYLLRDPINPVDMIDNLDDEAYESLAFFRSKGYGFSISQLLQIQQSAFRTENGNIDWDGYYFPYINIAKPDDLFVEATCTTAKQFHLGTIDDREAHFCLRNYHRGIRPEHFTNKPQWARHAVWEDGSYTLYCGNFLGYNPNMEGQTLYNILSAMGLHEDGNYFHMRFLAWSYHLGVRYEDIKQLDAPDCCRLEGGIGYLMQQKKISFADAYTELEGLTEKEISLYVNLGKYGLSKAMLTDSAFHRPYFLGSSQGSYFNSFLKSLAYLIITDSFTENYLHWPEIPLKHEHYQLILMLSKVVDARGQMPHFEKVIAFVATLSEEEAKQFIDCMEQITKKLLYQDDQLSVLNQYEEAMTPEEKQQGRPPYGPHLTPLAKPKIQLRIENNQSNGRVQSACAIDFETLTPIQSFLIACGSHYDLSIDLIAKLSDLEACEYACAFIAFRVDRPVPIGQRHDIVSGMKYDFTMTYMELPYFNLHEKRVLGQLSWYSLDDGYILKYRLNHQPFSFKQAQRTITLFNGFNGEDTIFRKKREPSEVLQQALDEEFRGGFKV